MFTEEELEEMFKENDRKMGDESRKGITFKCKPCWNFQSIEFEFTCTEEDIDKMFDLYSEVLSKLMLVTPEQEKKVQPVPTNLATDKQKEIMRKFGIEFTNKTTRKEAQDLIQASIDSSR